MIFNEHSNLRGQHAFLGASKYHWINYDQDKLAESYSKSLAVQRGIETHEFAALCIKRGQKLPRSRKTLNMFVNDSIGYNMRQEQILYFSDNCFGTADAISFSDKENKLRIHDLKTGVTPAHMEQLEIYAALFCLEYKKDPYNIDIELRIYQNDDIAILDPDRDDIFRIMELAKCFDPIINQIKKQEN